MGWKDWPYRLKGGIILTLLAITLFPFVLFGINKLFPDEVLLYLYPPIFIALFMIGGSPSDHYSFGTKVLVIGIGALVTFLIYFIIGGIFGLIYGKIKSEK